MLAELPEKSYHPRCGQAIDRGRGGSLKLQWPSTTAKVVPAEQNPCLVGATTVKAGLDELQTGVARLDQFFKRGRRKTEEKLPDLEKDIRRQVEPNCQVDPKFRSPFLYTRMTARAVGKVLLEQAGYQATELPSERTCRLESWKWTSVSYSWSSARRVKRAISSSIVCNFSLDIWVRVSIYNGKRLPYDNRVVKSRRTHTMSKRKASKRKRVRLGAARGRGIAPKPRARPYVLMRWVPCRSSIGFCEGCDCPRSYVSLFHLTIHQWSCRPTAGCRCWCAISWSRESPFTA